MKTGTLKELNVKPGDVVQVIGGRTWTISDVKNGEYLVNDPPTQTLSCTLPFRIISHAPDTPTLWRDMTPEEKGALLLAHHEGKEIEAKKGATQWCTLQASPRWIEDQAYRVKPEQKVGVVTSYWCKKWGMRLGNPVHDTTHRITFNTIDGKPDPASIKMEEIK